MHERNDAMHPTERSDPQLYAWARERVIRRRDFYVHAAIYAIVNGGLTAYSLIALPGDFGFLITVAGWGIGLVAHGLWVWSTRRPGQGWQERQIEQEMARARRRGGGPR